MRSCCVADCVHAVRCHKRSSIKAGSLLESPGLKVQWVRDWLLVTVKQRQLACHFKTLHIFSFQL